MTYAVRDRRKDPHGPSAPTLRVALAVDLPEADCALIEELEPRVQLVRDHALNAPARWDADWNGDPAFTRTPEQTAAFTELINGADALFGIPDVDPALLARTVRANPNLRWVHDHRRRRRLPGPGGRPDRDELERVTFTTSAGVHGSTLAEFALFGDPRGRQGSAPARGRPGAPSDGPTSAGRCGTSTR